jgi:hypothetical protein
MSVDRAVWESRLKQRFGKGIRIPGAIRLSGDAESLRITLPSSAPTVNMQTDESAFEVWCLALKAAEAKRITLAWDPIDLGEKDEDRRLRTRHWNRFLYRVHQFRRLNAWFRAEDMGAAARLIDSRRGWVLNVPNGRRPPDELGDFAVDAEERTIELNIAFDQRISRLFCGAFDLAIVERQLPVGVFTETVTADTAVFTRAKSAIDLWGISGTRLALFELKNADNVKAGALSELFLYATLMREVQANTLAFNVTNRSKSGSHHRIPETVGIDAFVLAPKVHPLLTGDGHSVLRLLNEAFADAGEPIAFGIATFDGRPRFVPTRVAPRPTTERAIAS